MDDKMPWVQEEMILETPPPEAGKKPPKPNNDMGRWNTLNKFVDCTMGGLSAVQSNVWIVLFRDTKPNGTAQVSYGDMARRAGCSIRGAKYALSALIRKRLVEQVKRGDNITHTASIYRLV